MKFIRSIKDRVYGHYTNPCEDYYGDPDALLEDESRQRFLSLLSDYIAEYVDEVVEAKLKEKNT